MFGNTSNKKKDMELPTFQATFPHPSKYLNFKSSSLYSSQQLPLHKLIFFSNSSSPAMSKDCECKRDKIHRRLFWLVVAVILVVLFIILIVWLALRPTKPRFILQNTDIIQFNLSSSSTLSSIIQATISSHNPNEHVGIYYDNLNVFISYKSQQVTLPSSLSPAYQGHGDVDAWSPFLYGNMVPIAPSLCEAIVQDENAGLLLLFIKIDGRLRWKVGSWISGHYHIYVNCPALLTFVNGKASGYSPSLKFRQVSACSVDV